MHALSILYPTTPSATPLNAPPTTPYHNILPNAPSTTPSSYFDLRLTAPEQLEEEEPDWTGDLDAPPPIEYKKKGERSNLHLF